MSATAYMCFSHKDAAFAKKVQDALENKVEGVEGITECLDDLQMKNTEKAILDCDGMVVVLSPDAIEDEVANWAIDKAVQLKKRIVPVVCRNVDYRSVRKELASVNWVFLEANGDGDEFAAGMKMLSKALDADLPHVKFHTKMTKAAQTPDQLLAGYELVAAKAFVRGCALGKTPSATVAQLDFIDASAEAQ